MDEDSIFADLLGSSGLKPQPQPQPVVAKPRASGSSGGSMSARSSMTGHAGRKEPLLPEPELLDAALRGPPPSSAAAASNGGAGGAEPGSAPPAGSRKELEDSLRAVVEGVVDASLSKFVRSLRTVLEDMGRRIEGTGQAAAALKESVDALREEFESHAGNSHARFTAIDLAVKEVERGVQSLRDKQELVEAQAMLARLSTSKPAEQAQAPASVDGKTAAAVATPPSSASAATTAAAVEAALAAPPASAPPSAASVVAAPPVAAAPPPPPQPQQPAAAAAPPPPPPPPCAPPMAGAPVPPGPPMPPPQQQQQPQYGPPPAAPYASQAMSAPPPGALQEPWWTLWCQLVGRATVVAAQGTHRNPMRVLHWA
jgi:hypothetical protein